MEMRMHLNAILLAGFISLLPHPAMAEAAAQADPVDDAAPEDDGASSAGEIVVTARKRSERLIEVPATINVFSSKDLAPSGNFTINDLSTKLPNFFITSPRATRISVTMRGLGVPGVGLYIDCLLYTSPSPRDS